MNKNLIKILLCVLYTIFSITGLTLIKLGANTVDRCVVVPFLNLHLCKKTIIGVFFYMISFVTYLGILSSYDLGYIIPVLGGIVNVLIVLVAFFFLKEPMSINMLIGAGIIIVGIFVTNL